MGGALLQPVCNSGSYILHRYCMGLCHCHTAAETPDGPIDARILKPPSQQPADIRLHNMTTGHGERCEIAQNFFCLNGGICYMIPSVSSPFCRCIGKYTGVRCEVILLSSEKPEPRSEFVANFLVLAAFLGLLLLGLIWFLCRKKQKNQCEEEP
ncbi:pro-neuregulin-4, membrane-bound isoform [Ascaphus truei]|uniref:pro-neuregulin-4, membrane-bound isoform n=1 Tax=Ascaphus truei TaxID=8439 RepID=UPI003F5AC6B7